MMWFAKLTGVHKLLFGLGGLLILALSFYGYGEWKYHKGYDHGVVIAENQVKDYQNRLMGIQLQLSTLQQGSDKVIVEKYYTNTNTIREVAVANSGVIGDNVKPRFTLTKGWIYAHNQAAAGKTIDPTLASDATEADVHDVTALLIVANNYSKCLANNEMLERLQEWIRTSKTNVDKANAEREAVDADKLKEVENN